jgi:DNA-binding MarR family transcriptional regulator
MTAEPPIVSKFLNHLYAHVTSHEALFLIALHEHTVPGGCMLQHILINRLDRTSPDGLRAVSIRLEKAGYIARKRIPPVKGQIGRPVIEVRLTDQGLDLITTARRAA